MPIDINKIRPEKGGNIDLVRQSETQRGRSSSNLDKLIELDQTWRKELFDLEKTREALGKLQKQITLKKKASKGQDKCSEEMEEKAKIETSIKDQGSIVSQIEEERTSILNKIGNIVLPTVPISKTEDDNRVERTWGQVTQTLTKDYGLVKGKLFHHQLMTMIGAFDGERGVSVVGHRGYFLKGVGVLLNMALINYGIAFLSRQKYTPLQPPFFMKKDVMAMTAELADFDEQLYPVGNDHYLIATSEQPISAYHRNETIEEFDLPKKYAGVSTCFRKEAGAHGKETWGLYRIHQFEKVEQFVITSPEESEAMHEQMIEMAEEFYQSLGLSYRVVSIVSGALNDAAAKKYDLEAWFPGYGEYKELVSCSNCTDYQSRAMDIKCGHPKMGEREKRFVHMLNSTLCATERCMCAIVENYQTEEGVKVPKVLQPFMGGMEFMPFITEEIPKLNK